MGIVGGSIKNYENLGGWLLFFFVFQWIFMAINGLTLVIGILAGITGAAAGNAGNFPLSAFIGAFIQVCISISFVTYIGKKPMHTASLAQVRIVLRAMTALSGAGLFVFLIMGMLVSLVPEYSGALSTVGNAPAIIVLVALGFVWNICWYVYFKRSNRAAVYFGELQQEDLKSGAIIIREMEKKLEQEIVDAFKEQEALSKDTAVTHDGMAIDVLDLTSKYAAVIHDMRFNRRLIKAVKGKYYYNAVNKDKYIANVPKTFYKVCGIILLVCLIMMAVAGIMIVLNA